MTRANLRRPRGALAAICLAALAAVAASAPVAAMQILDAADHAEIAAEISATDVNRIALAGDRIARVVRAPDGFAVEHDGASGDLYLRPLTVEPAAHDPVTLFIGTEKGFTYRLKLTATDRDSAQILIRNGEALPNVANRTPPSGDGAHIAALVRLVRAVARREPLPGYGIETGNRPATAGLTLIETWRGPRFAALVFEAARPASIDADGSATSPGPSKARPASGASPRSGWRRPAPGPPAGGSPWR